MTWTLSPAPHQESIFSFTPETEGGQSCIERWSGPNTRFICFIRSSRKNTDPLSTKLKIKSRCWHSCFDPTEIFIAERLKRSQWSLNWSIHLHQKQRWAENLLKSYRHNQRHLTGELPFSAIIYFYFTTVSDCLSCFCTFTFYRACSFLLYFVIFSKKAQNLSLHWVTLHQSLFFKILTLVYKMFPETSRFLSKNQLEKQDRWQICFLILWHQLHPHQIPLK